MKGFFLTFFVLCLCSFSMSAQRYQFKKFKTEDGLVNNETFAILQDRENRIWVTTTGGISCFNGKTFKNYTVAEGLASNIVFSIFEDSKGRIWAGTLENGVSIIENGKIHNPEGVDFKSLASANTILEGADGTIYIIFLNGIVTYKNGKLDYLLKKSNTEEIYAFQDADWFDDNTLYIASLNKGIFKLTLNPFKLENIYNEAQGINNICYSVFVDSEKVVWVGAYGELYKISKGKISIFRFNPADFDNNRIYGIYEENKNELFLSFEGNGIGTFNKTTGELKIINESQGLPTRYIYKTIKDKEGNHWMTSYGEGIIRFRDTAFKIYDQTQGLPSVNDLAEWKNQVVIASNEGIVAFDENKKFQTDSAKGPIKNLFVTPENTLLYNTKEAVYETTALGAPPTLIDEGDYSQVSKHHGKIFLFGNEKTKVISADSTYNIHTRKSIAITPIADRYILCKISGLYQLIDSRMDTIPGLSPNIHSDFRTIDVLNANEVLAGSESKLYHIALHNGDYKIKSFDLHRFGSLKYLRALKINGNDLWLAGRDLLLKVDLGLLLEKDSIAVKKFRTTTNFLENHIDLNSLVITKDGTIMASSLSGILALDEKEYLPNTEPPKLGLSEILLFSEPLDDSLYGTKKGIVLPFQKNYLTFSMEAITFINPENIKYQYRVKGLRDGDEWSAPTPDPQVVFSYLPPGDYTFEFIADNGDGVWQSTPYQYSFVITVPFWKTWYFWVSFLFIAAIGGFSVYYFKTQARQKRNQAYTHNLIKAQEDERTRVARELHDSVGQKLMLLTKKTKSTGNEEMESLANNTLQELRAISRGLHPATLERLGPTAAIRNMVDEIDANTNIFFTHEIEDVDALLSKEASLHLYRIIQEVLNNMVKHAEAKAASVTIEKRKNSIEAIISDNGKGFEYSEKVKTSDSLGMKTLMERAKILHSKIDIKSQLHNGTTVTLSIPI